jgi:curli biogenesis system outer membrane secretion channel CsgG
MKLVKSSSLIACALLLTGMTAPVALMPHAVADTTIAQSAPQSRIRLAVLDFDYADTGASGYYFGGAGPAKGVSDLLTNRLVQDGTYSMIERSQIDAILREQNLGLTGRIDASTAARIGQILGVDAIVIGSITRFNVDENRSGGSFMGIGGSSSQQRAEVELTARVVDTSTAEILAAVEGRGTARQGGGGVSIAGVSADSSNNNADALLSNAAEDAVNNLVKELASSKSRISN